jgi:hypothetical protein
MAAISSDDIWAVGYQEPVSLNQQPLIEHWDGTAWTVVDAPPVPGDDNLLFDVSGSSSNDLWAVGSQGNASTSRPLIEHWDGTAWRMVEAPPVPGAAAHLSGVTALASTDAWAVGERQTEGFIAHTLVMHWDGTAWSIIQAPSPDDGALGTVTAISPRTIWAAGSYYDPAVQSLRPLTMRSNGCH